MRILITGGAGFIGANLTLRLQERHPDAALTVLDNFSNANFENLVGFRGDVVTADMADPACYRALGDEPFDRIYHLAANTDTRVTDQALMMRQNVEAFRLLLAHVERHRTPIVYASSAATYGRREGIMREEDPVDPANVYAFSKAIMDNIARRMSAQSGGGWRLVGVRYFNVYGPGEAHKGVPSSMIYHLSNQMCAGKAPRIFSDGEQKRDFVYVDDVVEGTILAMEKAPASGIYNLGSGVARSFNELVQTLNTALAFSSQPEYFDNPYPFYQNHTEADLTRSKRDLGYQPRFSLERGVVAYMTVLHPQRAAAGRANAR